MTLADLPVVQQFSREEKLQLVADLWDHIAALPDNDALPLFSEEAALLDQRLAAHRSDPEGDMSLDEFMRQFALRR